jgi:hypothetical protein
VICYASLTKNTVSKTHNKDTVAFGLAAIYAHRAYQDDQTLSWAVSALDAVSPDIVSVADGPPTTRQIGSACAGMWSVVRVFIIPVTLELLSFTGRWFV